MTNEERRRAFAYRLQGEKWEDIGASLGYAGTTVLQDLQRCLSHGSRPVSRVYPELDRRIQEQYGGCVRAFAQDCRINPSTLYSMLSGRMGITPANASRMARVLGTETGTLLRRRDEHVQL